MTDLPIAAPEPESRPITASACGRTNAYTLTCIPTEQSMNYAACLWRQKLVTDPTINVPADWAPCAAARKVGACVAVTMRLEEEIAGKAIYFTPRGLLHQITDAAKRWIMPKTTPYKGVSKSVEPKYVPKKSMLDAMGDAGTLADAVSAAAASPAATPLAKRVHIPIIPAAHAGESPLAMARRLRGG